MDAKRVLAKAREWLLYAVFIAGLFFLIAGE